MKEVFFNQKSEIRLIWKLLCLTVISAVSLLLMSLVISLFNFPGIVQTIIVNFGLILAVIVTVRYVDRKPLSYIKLSSIKSGYKKLLFGLLIGFLLMTVNVFVLYLIGDLSFKNSLFNPNWSLLLLYGFISYIFVGISEELVFRGYLMTSLNQINKWVALLASSIIFSLAHGANNHITLLPLINLFLAGLFLGYLYLKSNNLYTVIGVHITWNYVQGYIFGISVSGSRSGGAMYVAQVKNNILTGGDFGLEGGIVNTVLISLAIIFVYLYYRIVKGNKKVI